MYFVAGPAAPGHIMWVASTPELAIANITHTNSIFQFNFCQVKFNVRSQFTLPTDSASWKGGSRFQAFHHK
jgi:hypothetical protein